MKKIFITIFISLLIGSICGFLFFSQNQKKESTVLAEINQATIFQMGVYLNRENAVNKQKLFSSSIIVEDGNYYRIYIAILNKKSNILKMKQLLETKKIDYYIKNDTISPSISEEMSYYEEIMIATSDEDVYLKSNKKILSLYEASL